jgi:pimeloyl-ACP methyl ester carboxylesterase
MRRLAYGLAFLGCMVPALTTAGEAVQTEHEGLRLNGNLEGDVGTGPVVLLVHGTLAHHGMELIRTLQDLLAERDLPSLGITLSLGIDDRSGMYDCDVPHRHRHGDALAEIAAWTGWLEGQGASEVILLGHSRGGNQVARLLAVDGGGVAAAVLLAPLSWDEAEAARADEARDVALQPLLERAADGESLEGVPFLSCPEATVEGTSFVSYYGPDPAFDTLSLLPEIDVPVLVIAGSDDQVVPGLAERLAGIDQPNVESVVIDGADHFFIEFFAEDVADVVAAFVEEQG